MNPNLITPPHAVRDEAKLADLVASMRRAGWVDRPILIVDCGTWQALTGSHRLAAAIVAGIDVPVIEADGAAWEAYCAANDDEERLSVAIDANDLDAIHLLQLEAHA